MATMESRLLSLISAIGTDVKNLITKTSSAFKGIVTELDGSDDQIGAWTVQDDGTSTSNWPNRFEMWFKTVGGVSRRTFLLNEYGEVRIAPAKSNTIPFRVFQKELNTDASRNMSVPLMEVMDDRITRTVIWQLMPDGTIMLGSQVQRLVSWEAGSEPGDLSIFPDGTWYGVRPAP